MEELWIFRATRHGKTRQSMRSAGWGSYPHHWWGICPRCQRPRSLVVFTYPTHRALELIRGFVDRSSPGQRFPKGSLNRHRLMSALVALPRDEPAGVLCRGRRW